MSSRYQVVVGNIGTIYQGKNPVEARTEYGIMVQASKHPYGRASGEPVTLLKDGEPLKGFEYQPPNQENKE